METIEHIADIIRPATIDDIPSIVQIWHSGQDSAMGNITFAATMREEEIKQNFQENITSQSELFPFWVYEKEKKVVAWCSILPFHPNPLLKKAWGIISMYIHPEYQNRLYGYLLSKHVLTKASNSHLRYIVCVVSNDNSRIKRLAEKMGFISLGVLPKNKKDNELSLTEIMIFEA
jgi:L-amino acid N-acyltransferase YncA